MVWHDLTKKYSVQKGDWGFEVSIGYSDKLGAEYPSLVLTRTKKGHPQFKEQLYIGKKFWKELFFGIILACVNEYKKKT